MARTMAGSPPAIPSLVGVTDHMSAADIASTIKNGKGRMPGFSNLRRRSDVSVAVVLGAGPLNR